MEPARACMTEEEALVWDLVSAHRGRAHAISAAELARLTGLSDRAVRATIKVLIEQFGCPIASTPQAPAGYFIPETVEEIAETLDSLKGRALSILHRMARLRGATVPELLHQLSLELAPRSKETADADPGHGGDQ